MEAEVCPKMNPSHGISGSSIGRSNWNECLLGAAHMVILIGT